MKILVTGSDGQAGVALLDAEPQWADVCYTDLNDLDIVDSDAVDKLFSEYGPDVVINAAAYTDVERAEATPELAHAINADGPNNLAKATKAVSGRMIQISTDYVFSSDATSARAPDDATQPINVYGKTKLAGEKYVLNCLGTDALILRTSWLYHQSGRNFVMTMLRLMNEKESISVVNDQIGAPTWAASLAKIIWTAIDKRLAGIYHWRDDGVASWYDFAQEIYQIGWEMGLVRKGVGIVPVSSGEFPTQAARPSFSLLDTSSTKRALDIAGVEWQANLRSMLEQLRNA